MCCEALNRRDFLALSATTAVGAGAWATAYAASDAGPPLAGLEWDPDAPLVSTAQALRVQPILMYQTPQRKEASSWKSWGGVQTGLAAAEEADRITAELERLRREAGFPLELLPVARVKSVEEAGRIDRGAADAVVVYPATGPGTLLQACLPENGQGVIFVRHRSGPIYYWYEALSVKYLATDGGAAEREEGPAAGRLSVHDVVVDDQEELACRLRALYGVKNLRATRVLALGGAWGKYAAEAPAIAREKYGLQIIELDYAQVEHRIRSAAEDGALLAKAARWADAYLGLPGTKLATDREFVVRSFTLYTVFKELMREHEATAFTIRSCMGTIMPMARTTACLTLSLLNDEGWPVFCESDFVVIPAGILLRHLAGRPVFLHNSTFPHAGVVTCAHCTSPRRMDGRHYEPALVTTHYESEFGAAPKVDMPVGQDLSFVNPEYTTGRWVGFTGVVEANPAYEICRSQQDVKIRGNWKRLLNEVRDSHWLMVYGDCLAEVGHAARRLGVRWESLCEG